MKPLCPSSWVSQRLLTWYDQAGRHHLPWKTGSVYAVWLSEIMLQQTQVRTVIPYFQRFLQAFPTVQALALAPLEQVLHYWAGLGYYSRARHLHKTAKLIVQKYQGVFPQEPAVLATLPGIGPSTAGAIAALGYEIRAPILDGNVKRVLCRLHGITAWPEDPPIRHTLWHLAETYTPHERIADYTQALMDLGATCCTRLRPQCPTCPLKAHCVAYAHDLQGVTPGKKPLKKRPLRSVSMLLAYTSTALLLYQRPPKGIWGSLWSLPEFPSQEELYNFIKINGRLSPTALTPLPSFRHDFTHFQWDITPFQLRLKRVPSLPLPEAWQWITPEALAQKGLPAPIKTVLHSYCPLVTPSVE